MGTLVVGDVHGCAWELERLIEAAQPDRVVLVGDLYTKGPDPAGVWQVLERTGADAVMGNHDQRLVDALDGRRPGDAGAAACIAALDETGPAWRAHLRALPLTLPDVHGWRIVHAGVHPTEGWPGTSPAMALTMRRWPADGPKHWHATYTQADRILYGHDALAGLVWSLRGGVPQVIGLDTGCVYGGALSGVVLPELRLVQVPARAVYRPIRAGGTL